MQLVTVRGSAARTADRRLFGPPRPAEVLAVLPTAVYLRLPDSGPVPAVLAVLAADAVRLPGSVLLPASSRSEPLTELVGVSPALATVGAATVRVGGLEVLVSQRWQQRPAPRLLPGTRPRWLALANAGAAALRATGGRMVADRAGLLDATLAAGDHAAALDAADRLHGLGPGLTPAGDDVLAGLLLTLRRFPALDRSALAARLGRRLAEASPRTTPLSAALLARAADGEGSPQLLDAVDAAASGQAVTRPLRRLLAVGHSSGAALALGAGLAGSASQLDPAIHLQEVR